LERGREVALRRWRSASKPPFLKLADSRRKKKEEKTQKLSRSGGTAHYRSLKELLEGKVKKHDQIYCVLQKINR